MGWIDSIINGVGMAIAPAAARASDKRQVTQQRALNDEQEATNRQEIDDAAKNSIRYFGIQPQIDRMKEAGMNPALLYGQSGGGATTMSAPSGAGGSQAPAGSGKERQEFGQMGLQAAGMGVQAMAQLALLKSQKDNIDADTDNKRAQNPNFGITGENIGTDTKLKQSQIPNTESDTKNKDAARPGIEADSAFKKTQAYIANETAEDSIMRINSEMQQQLNRTAIGDNERAISNATIDDTIKLIKRQAEQKLLENVLTRVQTTNAREITPQIRQQIRESVQRIEQGARGLELQDRRNRMEQDLRQQGLDQQSIRMVLDGLTDIYNFRPRTTTEYNEGYWDDGQSYNKKTIKHN